MGRQLDVSCRRKTDGVHTVLAQEDGRVVYDGEGHSKLYTTVVVGNLKELYIVVVVGTGSCTL